MSVTLSIFDKYNFIEHASKRISTFFKANPTALKVCLFINHLFRAAGMLGFMFLLPIPVPISMGICLAGSLFYRLTVEDNCAYKFALPAFFGALAFIIAYPACSQMISGVAFKTISSTALSVACLLPMVGYTSYVLYSVHHEVNKRTQETCCHDTAVV